MMRIVSFFILTISGSLANAARISGEELKLSIATLMTFLVISALATWLFRKWAKMNKEEE